MKSRYKDKIISRAELKSVVDQEVEKAYNSRIDAVYEDVRKDVAAQVMAVCCCELHTEFGFGKKRLKRFHRGMNALLRMMQGGAMGKQFTPVDCIKTLKDKYGIDLDREVQE